MIHTKGGRWVNSFLLKNSLYFLTIIFFSVVLPDYTNFGDFTDPGVVRKYKWRVVLPDYSWVCIKSRVGVVRKYNFLGLYILTTPALL